MQKTSVEGNVGQKWSGKKTEEEDGWRTVECLRGRLLAERVATRNAKEETQQLESKLMELEAQLKEETRSSKKAERRLRFLMKKLEASNITFVSGDSYQAGLSVSDKSEVTSVSSFLSSSETKGEEDKKPDAHGSMETKKSYTSSLAEEISCCSDDSVEKVNSTTSNNFKQNQLGTPTSHQHHECASLEEAANRASDTDYHLYGYSSHDIYTQEEGSAYSRRSNEEAKGNEDEEEHVDNTMALVPVELPKKVQQTIDRAVLDATVREVLDTLNSAKMKLQRSMEQRRMVRLGLKNVVRIISS